MEKVDFLSENGHLIYQELKKHCDSKLKMFDVDSFELMMLANSFDLYARSAEYCLEEGVSMTFVTEKGTYEQIRPQYTVMKNEYQNILKHGAKFGLNPGDREKIFKKLGTEKDKKKGFNLSKVA
jgi:phage terminase small subunit